jgi:hypothetical protein
MDAHGVLTSLDECNAALKALDAKRRAVARLAENHATTIEQADAELERKSRPHLQAAAILEEQLQAFVAAHPELFRNPKSQSLPWGDFGRKLGKAAIESEHPESEAALARELAAPVLPDLEACLKARLVFDAQGEVVEGLTLDELLKVKVELSKSRIHDAINRGAEALDPDLLERIQLRYRPAGNGFFVTTKSERG